MERIQLSHISDKKPQVTSESVGPVGRSSSFQEALQEAQGISNASSAPGEEASILVGTISHDKRTVSELLIEHDQLKSSAWDIINSDQNRYKEFRQLQPGTEIFYDPGKNRLSWNSSGPEGETAISQPERLVTTGGEIASELQEIGVISAQYPTVSHLLKADDSLGAEAWNILADGVNKAKQFDTLVPGTRVMYDPQTREISWQQPENSISSRYVFSPSSTNTTATEDVSSSAPAVFHVSSPRFEPDMGEAPAKTTGVDEPVLLGSINKNNPTVSHLLTADPRFRDDAWQLLNNSSNIQKPFHRIPIGTEVYIRPDSGEIFWDSAELGNQAIAHIAATSRKRLYPEEGTPPATPPAADLSEAVRPFMGKSYTDIDCYELLVAGLRRMDIRYEGKGGLLTRLTAMAREKGLPLNAYMNGEGIVKAAGSLVFSRNIQTISDWKTTADNLISELEPLLDKGQILSFSTENRGHTGIVSQLNDQWTFINSGRLDNVLTTNSPASGVGEEALDKEIRNWFRLAQANGESLMITLGKLEQVKTVTAYNDALADSAAKRLKNPG